MSKYLKFCQRCKDERLPMGIKCPGYKDYLSDDAEVCEYGHKLTTLDILASDFDVWFDISTDSNFYDAMIKLHDEDIIEYELKMSQFRNQVNQASNHQHTTDNSTKVKCPKCGSTSVTTGQRGFKLTTGFLGSNKTVNRCGNCGHVWKP